MLIVLCYNKLGLDKLVDWSNTWQLSLATSKCMHMRIGLNRCTMPAKFCINSQLLETKNDWTLSIYNHKVVDANCYIL